MDTVFIFIAAAWIGIGVGFGMGVGMCLTKYLISKYEVSQEILIQDTKV